MTEICQTKFLEKKFLMARPRHKQVNSLFLGNAKEVKGSRKRDLTFYPYTFPYYLNFYNEYVFLCDFLKLLFY